ncbi:hypothetical protein ACFE04_010686 [Oxalis oulophora]
MLKMLSRGWKAEFLCLDQYRSLVRFWQSEKGKKASKRGKTNMSNGKVPHVVGFKAFRRIAHEMKKNINKQVEDDRDGDGDGDGDGESDTQAGTDPARPWINDGYSKVMGPDKGNIVSLI